MRTDVDDDRSVVSLLKQLRNESVTLMRQELDLARAEMSEKASRAGRNVAYLVVGAVVLFAGLLFLLESLSNLLLVGLQDANVDAEIAVWLAPLVVGVLVGGIGMAMTLWARKTLKDESFVPQATLQTLKEDKQWIKEKLSSAPSGFARTSN